MTAYNFIYAVLLLFALIALSSYLVEWYCVLTNRLPAKSQLSDQVIKDLKGSRLSFLAFRQYRKLHSELTVGAAWKKYQNL